MIVLDNAHRLTSTSFLPVLLRTREVSRLNVCIVIISRCPWGSSIFGHHLPTPLLMQFEAYSCDQMIDLLMGKLSQTQIPDIALRDFFSCVMGSLMRYTKSFRLLQKAVGYLSKKYWDPVLRKEVMHHVNPSHMGNACHHICSHSESCRIVLH